ncbi:hypothetical protein ACFFX0_23845 [Citricoccus parietis]|uniref:Uncharacterized protein n=1 Tax=Citricoccus parietis TaxID=592307 RepID=A0ABV5G577_9MICC
MRWPARAPGTSPSPGAHRGPPGASWQSSSEPRVRCRDPTRSRPGPP